MKLCPLKYGKNYTLHLDKARITGVEELGKCDGDKCAYWIKWSGRCAINQIAQGFYIDKEMQENPTGEKKHGK